MKRRISIVPFLLIALIVFPVASFAASTSEGNPWDILIDKSPFTGTKLEGTLSIYFGDMVGSCRAYVLKVDSYLTLRLQKGFNLYAFKENTELCKGDYNQIRNILIPFFDQSILSLFPGNPGYDRGGWAIKSITNPAYEGENSNMFVMDFQIAVKGK